MPKPAICLAPSRLALAAALGTALVTAPAQAQQQPADSSVQPRVEDDLHNNDDQSVGDIIVTANGLKELDLLAGTSVVDIKDVQRNAVTGQIGDLLTKIPGVSASSFAPGASRPILRGQQGERVRVLVDGIGTSDVSNTSVDHATTIEPITVERIEVLRGPAVLLYGSQAIGGAVNVIDKRIPTRVPDEAYHLDAFGSLDSATNLKSGAASLDIGLSSILVAHVDGSYRKSDDAEIGGYQLTPALRQDVLSKAAAEQAAGNLTEAAALRAAADERGVIPNSATESWTVNGGLGLVIGESTLGASLGWYDTTYGIVTRPGGGESEPVSIGLQQFRADLKGDVHLGEGALERLKVRVGYSNYTHTEFEGTKAGTTFDNTSIEARAELVQNTGGVLRGSSGVQYQHRDFLATGDEAYIPPNLTDVFALFTLQEYGTGPFQIEAAARGEFTKVKANTIGIERDYDTFSGALGLVYTGVPGIRMGINGSRAERAPSAEELFANGAHVATQAVEIGSADLGTERAWGLEAYARGDIGGGTFSIAAYRQWFKDYIYLQDTGLVEDDLPVFRYLQQNADFKGIEADLSYPLVKGEAVTLLTDLNASYIEASFADGTAVPRIPPLSLLGALEAQTEAFDLRGEVQWFAKQDRIASFETETDSFAQVNALVAWRPLPGNRNITVQVAADNIFDVAGRRHSSFTKDYVPTIGRNFRASVRLSF